MSLSIADTTFPRNQVLGLLNPERTSFIGFADGFTKQAVCAFGHACRHDTGNVPRHGIVFQANAGTAALSGINTIGLPALVDRAFDKANAWRAHALGSSIKTQPLNNLEK